MPASASLPDTLTQIGPAWLDREKTLSKVIRQVEAEATAGPELPGPAC